MVRNVPIRYTQDMLLAEWPHDANYDFLYLPFCFKTRKNLGFAFVNFSTPEHAQAFCARWHKQRLRNHDAKKPLDIREADLQGRFHTILRLTKRKACRIKNSHFKPVIFAGRERITMEFYMAVATESAATYGVDIRSGNGCGSPQSDDTTPAGAALSAAVDEKLLAEVAAGRGGHWQEGDGGDDGGDEDAGQDPQEGGQ
jgi:hypothetical protein